MINSLILKLELLQDVLDDKNIRNELKQAVIVKVFLALTVESINDEIKNLKLVYPNISKIFYSDLVGKHSADITILRDALSLTQNELEKREQNESLMLEKNQVKDNINRIYFSYMYGMSYESKDFVRDFYNALNTDLNIVDIIGVDSLYFYINDILIRLDLERKNKYKEFYKNCIKSHLDRKCNEINNLDFLTNYNFNDSELIEELNKYFVELKQKTNSGEIFFKDEVKNILNHLLNSSSWPKQNEIDLAAVPEVEHEDWLRTDRNYFEAVFDFMRWVNNFSGDKPFKEFYDKTCSIYLRISKESEHKHRLSFILKRLGLSTEQGQNDQQR